MADPINVADIEQEPAGIVYEALLGWFVGRAATASLVVRDSVPLGAHGLRFLDRAKRWKRSERRAKEWPGTRLICGDALVLEFAFDEGFVQLLVEFADRLYAWQQPGLPEDLSLSASDRAMLASIAHEADAYLNLRQSELAELCAVVPGLRILNRAE